MRGTNTTNLVAGSMEVCVDSESRAMFHDGWGFGNARVMYVDDSQCKLTPEQCPDKRPGPNLSLVWRFHCRSIEDPQKEADVIVVFAEIV